MITATGRPPQTVESLKGLIGWFNHNSIELIEEYRRLEERVDDLKGELKIRGYGVEVAEVEGRLLTHSHPRSVSVAFVERCQMSV